MSQTQKKDWNCRNKDKFPLAGKCLVECIVYEATMFTKNQSNTYFGSAERDFKSRYNNHTLFHSKGYIHHTEFSKHIWSLNESNTKFSLKWHIKTKAIPYKHGSQKCNLCLAQKVATAWFEGAGLLHKWTELLCKCWHRNKSIIGNIKWTKTSTMNELIIASLFKYQLNCVTVKVSVKCYTPVKECFY